MRSFAFPLLVVVIAVIGAVALPSCSSFIPKSPYEQQKDFARGLEPESLAPTARRVEDRGVLRVRAYVDDVYGRGTLDPHARIRATLDDASRILDSEIGARLELVEVVPWTDSGTGDLREALSALSERDDADDIDLVVGFIGASPVVTDQLHSLGFAHILGRHAVVRDMNDVDEARAINHILNRMSEVERDELIARRRRHKAAIVLLHEVAHALGGVHVNDHEVVLFPTYSIDQNTFNEDALALLEIGLAHHRAATNEERAAHIEELKAEIERRRARLDAKNIDEVLASLSFKRDVERGALVLPPEQVKAYNAAVAALNARDAAAAWTALRASALGDDAHPALLGLACRAAASEGVVAMEGSRVCARSLAATPDALDPVIDSVWLARKLKDDVAERAAFAEAARRLSLARSNARTGDDEERDERARLAHLELARVALTADRLAIAEDALAAVAGSASDDPSFAKMRAQIEARRRRSGLPRGAVAADVEHEVLRGTSAIFEMLEKDMAAADALIVDLEKRLGGADDEAAAALVPALAFARCEWLRRSKKLVDAEKLCRDGVARFDDSSFGHVILGMVLVQRNKIADGVVELERALTLDPEYTPTWRVLYSVLNGANRKKDAAALDEKHRERFGKPIATSAKSAKSAKSATP